MISEAIRKSHCLLERGVFVIDFGFPVVREDKARPRTQMSGTPTIDGALEAFTKL
jgi:hypothetical protein